MLLLPLGIAAQDSTCTYDRCALRLHYTSSGPRLVQGQSAVSIARIGLYPPRIDLFAAANDSTRSHYEAFRQHHSRAATFGIVSLATLLGSVILHYSSDEDVAQGAAIGLVVTSFGFSLAAGSNRRRAGNELSQAIWFFNRELTHP